MPSYSVKKLLKHKKQEGGQQVLTCEQRSGENHDQSFAISRNAGTGPQGKTEHGSIRSLAPEENAGIESHNRLVVFIVT